MYSSDPIVNDIVLTIVNDGNGSECGMDYNARRRAAEPGLSVLASILQFRRACARYNRRRMSVYESDTSATDQQINRAADILRAYYVRHVAEG